MRSNPSNNPGQSKYAQKFRSTNHCGSLLTQSAGKHTWVRYDWFWSYSWLVEKWRKIYSANHKEWQNKTSKSRTLNGNRNISVEFMTYSWSNLWNTCLMVSFKASSRLSSASTTSASFASISAVQYRLNPFFCDCRVYSSGILRMESGTSSW